MNIVLNSGKIVRKKIDNLHDQITVWNTYINPHFLTIEAPKIA